MYNLTKMELLLNIAWLALAALAALFSWRVSTTDRRLGHLCRSHFVVLVGCLLTILFPVVSASDDLISMRTEMEEFLSSSSSVKQRAGSDSPTWASDVSTAAEPVRGIPVRPEKEPIGLVSEFPSTSDPQTLLQSIGCRAPPES